MRLRPGRGARCHRARAAEHSRRRTRSQAPAIDRPRIASARPLHLPRADPSKVSVPDPSYRRTMLAGAATSLIIGYRPIITAATAWRIDGRREERRQRACLLDHRPPDPKKEQFPRCRLFSSTVCSCSPYSLSSPLLWWPRCPFGRGRRTPGGSCRAGYTWPYHRINFNPESYTTPVGAERCAVARMRHRARLDGHVSAPRSTIRVRCRCTRHRRSRRGRPRTL